MLHVINQDNKDSQSVIRPPHPMACGSPPEAGKLNKIATRLTRRDRPKSDPVVFGAREWLLRGCFGDECKPEQISAASPVAYVDRNDPPMMPIVGTEERQRRTTKRWKWRTDYLF